MRRELTAVMAAALTGCTTTTRVAVTPDQLHDLSGLAPDEQRGFVPVDHTEKWIARGNDEVRLNLRPGRPVSVAETPWVELCLLQWEPPYGFGPSGATGTISDGVVRVPASDVTGAELQLTRPDGWKTAALVGGIVLGLAAVAVLAGLVGTAELMAAQR